MNVFNYIYWISAYFTQRVIWLIARILRHSSTRLSVVVNISYFYHLYWNCCVLHNVCDILYKHSLFRPSDPNDLLFGTYNIYVIYLANIPHFVLSQMIFRKKHTHNYQFLFLIGWIYQKSYLKLQVKMIC